MDTPNIHRDTKINGIPENQAFDLITELEKALLEAEGNQQLVFLKNQQLVDNLIANETLPEVYAQRLLRLKVFFKIKQGQYDNALLDLSVLDNTENRLVCATYEFYKLLFVKYDILIAKGQHLEAYNFLKAIKINFFEEEAFLKLKEHQALFREWTIKSAIAAHFIADNESYNLFRSLLFDPTSVFHLDARNKDILLFYGYECFRQKKYPEAITAFATLSEINSNASFLQETKAMMNFSKIANNEIDSDSLS